MVARGIAKKDYYLTQNTLHLTHFLHLTCIAIESAVGTNSLPVANLS